MSDGTLVGVDLERRLRATGRDKSGTISVSVGDLPDRKKSGKVDICWTAKHPKSNLAPASAHHINKKKNYDRKRRSDVQSPTDDFVVLLKEGPSPPICLHATGNSPHRCSLAEIAHAISRNRSDVTTATRGKYFPINYSRDNPTRAISPKARMAQSPSDLGSVLSCSY